MPDWGGTSWHLDIYTPAGTHREGPFDRGSRGARQLITDRKASDQDRIRVFVIGYHCCGCELGTG